MDDEEAVAVAIGLRTAASGSVAGIEEMSVRAPAKLEQMLPARLRQRVSALQSFTVPMMRAGPTVSPETLSTVAAACRDNDRLGFEYRSFDGATSHRTVEPNRLVSTGRVWYLLAWDVNRQDWRTFRVDRIEPKLTTGPRFAPRDPPEEDVARYVSRAISSAPYLFQARVRLHASAPLAAESVSPSSGHVEPVDEQSCILTTGASSLDGLTFYLVHIGLEFEVLDPPELVEHVRAMARRLARATAASVEQPGH